MDIRRIIISAAGVILASCSSTDVQDRAAIPYVRDILSDRFCDEFRMLSEHRSADPSADICIVGDEAECLALADYLAARDKRDNINGAVEADGLLDFSGETFSCIIDTLGSSYGELLGSRKEYLVRERAVRIAMNAVDTVLHLSPYDLDGMGFKNSSKVLVLANPIIDKYGKFDIDTLFRGTGCACSVISPIGVMMDEAFSEQRPLSIGILAAPQYSDTDVFMDCFERSKASHPGTDGSECVVIPTVVDSISVMKPFLDAYIASGNEKPLDVIMVDDLSLDVSELKSELAMLISIMNEESMVYGKLISNNFRFLNSASSVSKWIYDYLREANLFTHNISKPLINTYIPVNAQDESQSLLLIPGTHYVQN